MEIKNKPHPDCLLKLKDGDIVLLDRDMVGVSSGVYIFDHLSHHYDGHPMVVFKDAAWPVDAYSVKLIEAKDNA